MIMIAAVVVNNKIIVVAGVVNKLWLLLHQLLIEL